MNNKQALFTRLLTFLFNLMFLYETSWLGTSQYAIGVDFEMGEPLITIGHHGFPMTLL